MKVLTSDSGTDGTAATEGSEDDAGVGEVAFLSFLLFFGLLTSDLL